MTMTKSAVDTKRVSYRIISLSGPGLPTGCDEDGYDTREAAEAMASENHDGRYCVLRQWFHESVRARRGQP